MRIVTAVFCISEQKNVEVFALVGYYAVYILVVV
jgi:hypothetical protein